MVRCVDDFVEFCRFFLAFDPHEKQREFARPVNHVVMSCGSGLGKSVGGAALMLWVGWRARQRSYGVFAPTNRQVKFVAEDMANHIARGGNKLSLFIARKPTIDEPYWEFTNGSKIWMLNTAYGAENSRGLELHGAWCDETALMSEEVIRLVDTRVRLAPAWRRYSSTPKGKVGAFFAEAHRADEEQRRAELEHRSPRSLFIKAASADNPHYDRQVLADRKATMDERYWAQEYEGEFVDMEGATFRQVDLDRVFDARWEPESSARALGMYAHGWDFGQVNYTVGTTLAFDEQKGAPAEVRGIDQEEHRGADWSTIYDRVNMREADWSANGSTSESIIDFTGIGRVIEENLSISPERFTFTRQSRAEMTHRLMHAVQKPGRLVLPRYWTHLYASMQLHTPREDAPGETWDHYDSLGLAYWLACERQFYSSPFGVI